MAPMGAAGPLCLLLSHSPCSPVLQKTRTPYIIRLRSTALHRTEVSADRSQCTATAESQASISLRPRGLPPRALSSHAVSSLPSFAFACGASQPAACGASQPAAAGVVGADKRFAFACGASQPAAAGVVGADKRAQGAAAAVGEPLQRQ